MALRPESSVSLDFNEYGELVFAADRPGPVIHRTPEELGIPRVLPPDPPARRDVRMDYTPDPRGTMRANGLKRDRLAAPRVLESRESVTASTAELVGDVGAADVAREESGESDMEAGKHARPTDDLKAKILNEPDTSVAELVAKYGATRSQIYNWRYAERKEAAAGLRAAATKRQRPVSLARPVEIDPQRPGTAAALIGALARHDAAVRIELSHGEVADLLRKMSAEQQQSFLAAGLKAGLLG